MKISMKTDNEIIFEYINELMRFAYDNSNRGKKGMLTKIEKLGAELIKRGILTEEQVHYLLW